MMAGQATTEPQLEAQAVAGLSERVRGPVLTPDNPAYDDARSIWNALIDRRPALIVQCSGAADVVDAVNFARRARAHALDQSGRAQRCRERRQR
jgi:hypothetical protein